jgi:hypothetical protein
VPQRGDKTFMDKKGWDEDVWQNWGVYIAEQYRKFLFFVLLVIPNTVHFGLVVDVEPDSEDGSEIEEEKVVVKLEKNAKGYAILPDRNDLSLEDCKRLVWDYVTINYHKFFQYHFDTSNLNLGTFCRNLKAKVHWTAMAENPGLFFQADHLPPNVALGDPWIIGS